MVLPTTRKKQRVLHNSRPCYQDWWHTDLSLYGGLIVSNKYNPHWRKVSQKRMSSLKMDLSSLCKIFFFFFFNPNTSRTCCPQNHIYMHIENQNICSLKFDILY